MTVFLVFVRVVTVFRRVRPHGDRVHHVRLRDDRVIHARGRDHVLPNPLPLR